MTTRKERAAIRRRQQKINTILLAAGAFLVVIVISLFLVKPPAQVSGPAQVGRVLEDFSLTDIHGKTVHLSDYSGKTVLVNAWATWCPPCKAEMPDLNAYYQSHKDDGFVILAINAGDPAKEAAAFASQKSLAFPVLLDPDGELLTRLGVHSFPTSILIGTDGVVKAIHVGMFTPKALEEEVTPYLQK